MNAVAEFLGITIPSDPRAAAEKAWSDLKAWAAASPDLALLAGLLVLTAMFGRPFSKIGAGNVYVTELAIVGIAVLGIRRVGLRGALDRIRHTLPLVALGVFWLAGAVAAVRGLAVYDVRTTIQDIGLVEYSIFLPLVAVAVDTRAKADAMLRVLAYAGLAATAVFAVVFFFLPDTPIGVVDNPTSAVGIYLALWLLPVAARLVGGERPAPWELGVAGAALLLMAFGAGRSVLVALAASLFVVAVLSPRPLRTLAAGVAGIAVAVGAVVGLQSLGFGERDLPAAQFAPASVTVGSSLALGDGLEPAQGGKLIERYAAGGDFSREAAVNQAIEVPMVMGLVPGDTYTISFSVLPLDPNSTRGIVGNNAGTGWGMVFWHVKPDRIWQRRSVQLTATTNIERLMFVPDVGTLGARFDAVRITRGAGVAAAQDASERVTTVGGGRAVFEPRKSSSLLSAIVDSFNPHSNAGEYQNANWRLDFWSYLWNETLDSPAFGVGFAHPAAFQWNGHAYDTRRPGEAESLSPPHNSFLNILYRTGFVGLLALVALLATGVVRALRLLRATPAEERPPLVALLGLAGFIVAIAFLNVALEGPYMAMFFWTVLGLLLVLPALSRAPGSKTAASGD